MNDPKPLPLISDAEINPVPVFNCQVILGKPDQSGRFHGRVANLAGISATGFSERDVLTSIMKQFKAAVKEYHESKTTIPFVEPPEVPGPDEAERFIPVHL